MRSRKRFATVVCLFLLSTVALYGQLKAPEEFAGFPVGSDGNLVKWDRIVDYFKQADQASDRIVVQELGKTTLGNPFLLAVVSSPSNLARIDEIQATQKRLAYPYDLDEQQAAELAWSTPAVLLITLNIHSTEIGSSQMALELIHRLATEESPRMRNVLDNVVFLLVPSLNPDGQIMVTDWYYEVKETEHEGASMPWLYHHYTGHDNNRDAFMLTQRESRLITKVLYQDWFPQVYLDEHQMGFSNARIFVPPWTNPINPNVDSIIWAENGLLGFAMFTALNEAGKQGVIYDQTYTSWWQGGFVMEAWWHNMAGLLTEVASVRVATPIEQEKAQLGRPPRGPAPPRRRAGDFDPDDKIPAPRDVMPRNNYPRPWLGGKWTLRDIVDYELIATYGLLEAVANNRTTLIQNQVRMGRTAIEAGKSEPPYAYLFPPDQHDPAAAYRLLEILNFAGVEIHRAAEPFEAGGKQYPVGTHAVLTAQPFRAYAKDMLEIQQHPDPADFPPGTMREQPYDVTGWTLPLQMGVDSREVAKAFEARWEKLDTLEPPGTELVWVENDAPQWASVSGNGQSADLPRRDSPHGFLIQPGSNNATRAANRLLKAGTRVSWITEAAEAVEDSFPAGSLHVQGVDFSTVATLLGDLGLQIEELSRPLEVGSLALTTPRVGLYQPWTGSMDEGWTRWLLEQYEFEYETLRNADLKQGSLRERFDAIIFPGDRSKSQILNGNQSKRTPEKYRGGIGEEGLENLEAFVRAGGTLLLLGSSYELALESWPVPVKNVLNGVSRNDFSCPGSLLRIHVDTRHPIAFGMRPESTAVFSNNPAFDLAPGFSYTDVKVIARYPGTNPLQSGWIHGDSHLHNRVAAAEVGYDKGRIVLLGFRAQFRAQPHNTFKLVFNTLHYSAAR